MKLTHKIFSLAMAMSLLVLALPAKASEVTGNLTTGLVTGVEGTVVVAPTASPSAGTYATVQNVALAAAGSTSIHYTLDGSTPTCSGGSVYSEAISVATSKTIKAIACYAQNTASAASAFDYVLNLNVSPGDLPALLSGGELQISGGSATSTPSVTVAQDLVISVAETGGTNTVSVPAGTIITSISGANFDATALSAADASNGSLSGLGSGVVVDGALQWGIVNLGLQFSNPVTLTIFVGASFNGQTLNIVRSTSSSGGWTSDGIVAPATCVVSAGQCVFQATKASYYAATNTTSSTGGGGGGGGVTPSDISIVINSGSPETNTTSVTLTLRASNAAQMMISNDSNFTGSVWEPFAASKAWVLPSGNGKKTVYAKFLSSTGGASGVASDFIALTSAAVATPPGQVLGTATIKNGTLVLDGFTIYLISNGQKRAFATEAEFFSYGFKFSDVVSNTAITDIPEGPVMPALDGTLALDTSDNRTIYFIGAGGVKRGFASASVFKALGYKFSQAARINLSGYQTGLAITSALEAHPDGALVFDGKTVWWINYGKKQGFPTMGVFNSYGLDFKKIVKANKADLALPEGSITQSRDIALAQ